MSETPSRLLLPTTAGLDADALSHRRQDLARDIRESQCGIGWIEGDDLVFERPLLDAALRDRVVALAKKHAFPDAILVDDGAEETRNTSLAGDPKRWPSTGPTPAKHARLLLPAEPSSLPPAEAQWRRRQRRQALVRDLRANTRARVKSVSGETDVIEIVLDVRRAAYAYDRWLIVERAKEYGFVGATIETGATITAKGSLGRIRLKIGDVFAVPLAAEGWSTTDGFGVAQLGLVSDDCPTFIVFAGRHTNITDIVRDLGGALSRPVATAFITGVDAIDGLWPRVANCRPNDQLAIPSFKLGAGASTYSDNAVVHIAAAFAGISRMETMALGRHLLPGVTPPSGSNAVDEISIASLVATPEQFHGKVVRVVGWATFAFEIKGIFVSAEQATSAKNGIWLDVPLTAALREFREGEVVVEGEFDRHAKGHLGMWSGSLTRVLRLETFGSGPMKNLLEPA